MARHSEVQIQGTNVPGLIMKVTVPVDHYVAPDTARGIYNYPDADYIWLRSWETDQPAKSGGSAPSSSTGEVDSLVALLMLPFAAAGLALVGVGYAAVGAWKVTEVVAPIVWKGTKWTAPKVWKGYTKVIQGTEWVLANTR